MKTPIYLVGYHMSVFTHVSVGSALPGAVCVSVDESHLVDAFFQEY